jgi:cell division protein FtsZ
LDFADVRAIMSEMGKAMMGTGEATGDKRAIEAAEAAISNPLLDDVSMRGARGLLISITGGPDLTLYEVDEAATRIREEVDPEANIILGATFDESLEGTMRVSVVATGLPVEMSTSQQEDSEEEPAEEPQASRQVFGFTGKQPPAKKPVQPAPMAARVAPRLAAETAAPDQIVARQTQQRSHRMPAIEDFPPIAQKQIAARQNRIEHIAEHSARRKKGLFERLAGVGLGRKEDEAIAPPKEPSINMQQVPRSQMNHPPRSQPQPQPQTMHIDPGLDDDQLEIPAFLRRQAN